MLTVIGYNFSRKYAISKYPNLSKKKSFWGRNTRQIISFWVKIIIILQIQLSGDNSVHWHNMEKIEKIFGKTCNEHISSCTRVLNSCSKSNQYLNLRKTYLLDNWCSQYSNICSIKYLKMKPKKEGKIFWAYVYLYFWGENNRNFLWVASNIEGKNNVLYSRPTYWKFESLVRMLANGQNGKTGTTRYSIKQRAFLIGWFCKIISWKSVMCFDLTFRVCLAQLQDSDRFEKPPEYFAKFFKFDNILIFLNFYIKLNKT